MDRAEVSYEVVTMEYVLTAQCHGARTSKRLPDTDILYAQRTQLLHATVFEPPLRAEPLLTLPAPPDTSQDRLIALSHRIKWPDP